MLALLYLLAVWTDPSPPARSPQTTYALMAVYIFFAASMAALTWSNWWRDARLAGPAHAVDIVMFTALVLLTEGYTSPFFIFFMFVLLAAAFRWNWHATALTATLLTLLYLVAGLIVKNSGIPFELPAIHGPHRSSRHPVADRHLVRRQPAMGDIRCPQQGIAYRAIAR